MFLVLADIHQGLSRKTGVTPTSLEKFEARKSEMLRGVLQQHQDKEVIIAGDLFDSHQVPLVSVLQIASVFLEHPKKVWVIAGNHDLSKNTMRMSSLWFLKEWSLLHNTNIDVVFVRRELGDITLLPHVANQDLFDENIEKAKGSILITHCNYENGFAVDKDHSLNLTKKQARKFDLVISGHEHNRRKVGNVNMIGSFAPCNVNEAAVDKFCYVLDGSDLVEAQRLDYSYAEIPWGQIEKLSEGKADIDFIKVTGEATAAEAPVVLNTLAKFRKNSSAVMIQNAVTVETLNLGEIEGASFDSIDTMKLLGQILKPEHKEQLGELGYDIK